MFIIDSNHRLIAAEAADLERWNAKDLYDAARMFREGSLRLDTQNGLLDIEGGRELAYDVSPMESLLGEWLLCRLPETIQPAEETLRTIEKAAGAAAVGAAVAAETTAPETEELSILPLQEEEEEKEEETATAAPEEILPVSEEQTAESIEPIASEEAVEAAENEEEELLSIFPLEAEEEKAPAETLQPLEEGTGGESLDKEIEELLGLGEEEGEIPLLSPDEETEREEGRETEQEEELLPLLAEEEEIPELQSLAEEEEEEPETLFPMPEAESAPWKAIADSFRPDLAANAQRLELSEPEYADLVREFVQDSRSLRDQLLSETPAERNNAAAILKDAVILLHLSPLDQLLEQIAKTQAPDRTAVVDEYERLLDELEMSLSSSAPTAEEPLSAPTEMPAEEETEAAPELPVLEETPVEKTPTAETATEETPPAPEAIPESAPAAPETEAAPAAETAAPESVAVEEFLRGVKPIPIEFSLQIASQELNLPEELVLEFINDFAKQGHEYLPVLIDDYQKKDLDHLQKTAHMLKGAASNLRIEAMVDNLYDLQFDNNLERAPQRIRLFAGQLMSLDNYLEQMNR